jgi:hypothetical protein
MAWSLLLHRSGLAEQRLAQRLDISRGRLADVSFRLWRRTFSDERDRRAGPHANKQKRGQVSRTLPAELEKGKLTDTCGQNVATGAVSGISRPTLRAVK